MMSRVGDWKCRSCEHLNFQRRECCQRCGDSKSGASHSSFVFVSDVRPGDWYCNCGAHNFASRSNCFKCATFRNHSTPSPTAIPGWKSGDWICNRSGCNEHNFASRVECFKCFAPRDSY